MRVGLDLILGQMNPKHPISYFHIGNKETLLKKNRSDHNVKQVIDFYKKNYGEKTLQLGIYGPFPPAVMINWLEKDFCSLQHAVDERLDFNRIPLYKEERTTTKFIRFIPRKKEYITAIAIPIEYSDRHKKIALEYLSTYLNRNDEGSLAYELKKQNLVTDVFNNVLNLENQTVLLIAFEHQEEAKDNTQKILDLTLSFLKQTLLSIDTNFVDIQKNIADRTWMTVKPQTSYNELINAFDLLKSEEPSHIMIAPYEHIKNYATVNLTLLRQDLIAPERWIVAQAVDTLESNHPMTSRYDSLYTVSSIKVKTIDTEQFFKPMLASLYQANDLTVLPAENMPQPVVYDNQTPIRKYFWSNSSFKQPLVFLTIKYPKSFDQLRSFKESIALTLFNEQCIEIKDKFKQGGFVMNLTPDSNSLLIIASGFRDNFIDFYQDYFSRLFSIKLEEKYFLEQKNMLINHFNALINKSSDGIYYRLLEVSDGDITLEEKLNFLKSMTLDDIQVALNNIFIAGQPELFLGGNLTHDDAAQWFSAIEKEVNVHPFIALNEAETKTASHHVHYKTASYPVDLPQTVVLKSYIFNLDKTDTPVLEAQCSLIEALLSAPAFEELRTKDQLGYAVSFSQSVMLQRGQILLSYKIISDNFNKDEVLNKINLFEQKAPQILHDLGEENFNKIRSSLVKKIMIPPSSVAEAYQEYSFMFNFYNSDFSYKQQFIHAIESQSFTSISNFIENIFLGKSAASIYVINLAPTS
jgi:secreted Zn-dependent insulinase-like peptidase